MRKIIEKDIELLTNKEYLTYEEKAIVRTHYRRMFLNSLSNSFFTVIEIGADNESVREEDDINVKNEVRYGKQ